MVNFTVDEIRKIMSSPDRIRNMSVIAHVDHGKSTLTDSLIAKAGIIAEKTAGEARYMDTREDEQDRCITIKSTGVSLYFNDNGEQYLINLIDSPGHVDFSSEVTAALRVTDGALVVVDCVEGVCVQTETVLRQAMQERIIPVLMVNKVDRAILELKLDGESMYKSFVRVIDRVNMIISNYKSNDVGELHLTPEDSNIAFGSGKEVWGFTLHKMASLYSKKFNIPVETLTKKLWGDHFYDPKKKLWVTEDGSEQGNKPLKRGFCQFIVDPIVTLAKACISMDQPVIDKIIKSIGITLTSQQKQLQGKHLFREVMSHWINAADALLEMIVQNLPSPKKAQVYRAGYLYEGPIDDPCGQAMKNCDPEGPLMIYISKMVPTADKGRFFAFGRVFSGTVRMGQKVRIMGPNYVPGSKIDFHEKNIQRTVLMMGRKQEFVPDVPCGNTVGLVGIDQCLVKTGTISDQECACNIKVMKYSVSPVVRVAVKPKNSGDLPKLIAGMQRLAKSDPLVLCTNDEETGENIIAGCGELHVEVCLKDLVEEFSQIEIIKSNPIVAYRETVREKSKTVMAKSNNNHNRLFCYCEPISEELTIAVEKGEIPFRDQKEKTKVLVNKFGFEKNEVGKIWSFGPEGEGPNLIVDQTVSCQYMNEIKDHMVSGFEIVTKTGVLCNEMLRSVKFAVEDTTLHTDAIHRGAGQITPATRKVLYGTELLADPTLEEPIFLCEVNCPTECVGTIYGVFGNKRGTVEEQEQLEGVPLTNLKAFLPVSESFGFDSYLREKTSGRAFPNCIFDHWDVLGGSIKDANCNLYKLIMSIRKRKGLKEEIPDVNNYIDKL